MGGRKMSDTPDTDNLRNEINADEDKHDFDFAIMTEHSRKLERERNKYKNAILSCLEENLHLADGEDCTLITLKRALL